MVRTEKAGSQAEKMAAAAMDELNLDDLFGDGGDDLLKDCEMDMINVVGGTGDTSTSMEFESLKTEVIEAGDKSFTAATTATTTTTTKSKRSKRKGGSNKKNPKKMNKVY